MNDVILLNSEEVTFFLDVILPMAYNKLYLKQVSQVAQVFVSCTSFHFVKKMAPLASLNNRLPDPVFF